MRRLFLAFVLFFVMAMPNALADKTEWIDKNYDFSKVREILVILPDVDEKLKDGIKENQLIDEFKINAQGQKFKFAEIQTLIDSLSEEAKDRIVKAREQEHTDLQIHTLIAKELNNGVQRLVLFTKVYEYTIGSVHKNAYTYTTTEYETSTIETKENGQIRKTTIQIPVKRTHNVPERYIRSLSAAARFEVLDTRSGAVVLSRNDSRYREPDATESQTPANMYKRLLKDFFGTLHSKIG